MLLRTTSTQPQQHRSLRKVLGEYRSVKEMIRMSYWRADKHYQAYVGGHSGSAVALGERQLLALSYPGGSPCRLC